MKIGYVDMDARQVFLCAQMKEHCEKPDGDAGRSLLTKAGDDL